MNFASLQNRTIPRRGGEPPALDGWEKIVAEAAEETNLAGPELPSGRKPWSTPQVILAALASETAKLNRGPEHTRSAQISYGPS